MVESADFWIERLGLADHPEGGHYREIYRSFEYISGEALPERFTGTRAFSTCIYFLLKENEFSALHRLKTDEIWHFFTGSSLTLHIINKFGKYSEVTLGEDLQKGEVFQFVVEAGSWFGAKAANAASYSLVGCTTAPGFDFQDFEMGKREELVSLYPKHRSIIEEMTG